MQYISLVFKTLLHATSLELVAFVMVPLFRPYWGFGACGWWRTSKIIKIQNIFFNLVCMLCWRTKYWERMLY